jgi:leucine dehydrogenase
VLDDDTVPRLRCRVIAGAANNQLADERIADLLAARGILWAPDFVVNAGGLINIAEELGQYNAAAARRRVRGIADTLRRIFADAEASGATPLTAAMELARRRLVASETGAAVA